MLMKLKVGVDATFLQLFLRLISLYLNCYHWSGKPKRPAYVPNIDAAKADLYCANTYLKSTASIMSDLIFIWLLSSPKWS